MQINTTKFTHILWVSSNRSVHLRLNTATNLKSIQFKLQNNIFVPTYECAHCSAAPDFTDQISQRPKIFIFWGSPYVMQRTNQANALRDAILLQVTKDELLKLDGVKII